MKLREDILTNLPSLEELKYISVKIERKVSDGERELLGTGTVFCDGGQYYVLTASHCFKDDAHELICDKKNLVLTQFYEKKESHLDLKDWELDKYGDDVALLEVDPPKNDFDYANGLKLIASELEGVALEYGFTYDHPKGMMFKYELKGDGLWQNKDGIVETGEDLYETLRGTSGGGLIKKVRQLLLCIAFVKSTFNETGKMNLVNMQPLGDLNKDWKSAMLTNIDGVEEVAMKLSPYNKNRNDYERLLYDLYNIISKGEDVTDILEAIEEHKKKYPYPKSIHQQENIISLLLRKKDAWSDGYKEAFLLSLEDRGLWLALFGKMPETAKGIEEHPLCKKLDRRAQTLMMAPNYEGSVLAGDDDDCIYENIMRAGFALDFKAMKEMVGNWKPEGFYIARKSLLSNMFEDDEGSHEKLKQYLDDGLLKVADERFIATTVYNLVHKDFRTTLPYKPLRDQGIEGPSDVMGFMAGRIDKPKEKIEVYGTHYSQLFGGNDTTSFPEALRLIQYLMNTGLTPSYKYNYLLSKENWLKVVKYMLHFIPYPVVFYTLTYSDEKLIKRIGQEMVYTSDEDVVNKLPYILRRLLEAFADNDTPKYFYTGIFGLTQELYIAVKEEDWFPLFIDNVLSYFCKDIPLENVTKRDFIFKNVYEGIKCVSRIDYRIGIFKMLSESYDKNPYLVSILISEALRIDKELLEQGDVKEMLITLVKKYTLKDTCHILFKLVASGLLDEDVRMIADDKALSDTLEYGVETADVLGMLSHVLKQDDNVKKIKEKVLGLDMWNCGVIGGRFTDPRPANLENYNKDLDWTEEEWNVIRANMRENIEQIEKHQPNEELMRHFNRGYISLLTGMNIFVKSIKYETREEEMRVTQLLEKLRGYNSPLAALSSDDYDSVIDGTFFLLEEVKDKGVEGCLTEIGLLVNRVLLQKKEGLESCMSLLYGIMEEYAEVMVKHFGPQLIEMLKRYSDDFDYQELKVRVPNVYFILRNIARWMEPMYSGERSIEYWMNAPAVNRFNIG